MKVFLLLKHLNFWCILSPTCGGSKITKANFDWKGGFLYGLQFDFGINSSQILKFKWDMSMILFRKVANIL